ncbi:MAG TPA: hypothetical protein DIS88_06460 [Prevotella sp.]|nr:hypothetical protein [Prevotella sp.]
MAFCQGFSPIFVILHPNGNRSYIQMKVTGINGLLFLLGTLSCPLTARAQDRLCPSIVSYRVMTLGMVDSMVVKNSLSLQSVRLETEKTEGQLRQVSLYENPQVQLMHNVRNPNNKRWLDTGHDGETDVQVSQSIAIGGQHSNKVRQARADIKASQAGYLASRWEICHEVRQDLIDLYGVQQKEKVYEREIESVERILKAFQEQTAKGNVSKMETFRIQTMLSQLKAELSSLCLQENDLQAQLHTAMNMQDGVPVKAQLDDDELMNYAKRTTLSLASALGNPASLALFVDRNPSLQQIRYQQESARYQLKSEQAEALPHISLMGEFDKNGSIGHNFFAFGTTITVPLWNRNQGNVRTAKATYRQAQVEREYKESALRRQILRDHQAVQTCMRTVENQKRMLDQELEELLQAAESQFMKRNITLLEFVDLYGSYRDTQFQMLDARAQLFKAVEDLRTDLSDEGK